MKTRWMVFVSVAAMMLSVADQVRGQADLQAVGHLLDAQTLVVAEVDLQQLDLVALRTWIAEATEMEQQSARQLGSTAEHVNRVLADLRHAGADRMYAGFSLADMGKGEPVWFAVSVQQGDDAAQLVDAYPSKAPYQKVVIDGVLVIAQPPVMDRLRTAKAIERPDLQAALVEAGDAPIRIAVSLPEDARRGLVGMLPQLPESPVGVDTQALIGGLQWVNAAVHLPPQPRISVTLRSADAASAGRLADWLKEVLPKIAADEPLMNRLVAQLTIRADAQRVYLELDEPQLRRALAAYYREDRVRQLRIKSSSNLRQIAIAILIYANENNEMTPPDLGTLLLSVDIDASALIDPRDGMRPPDDLNPQERADWVNQHTSYVYLRPSVKLAEIAPDAVMVYERQPDEKGEVNVLFGDGHTDRLSKTQLDQRLAK